MKPSPRIIRVAPATVVIFSTILSPVLLGGIMTLWQGQKLWNGSLVCIGYFFALYGICSPTVELLPGRLVYRALFIRREIELADVAKVQVSARPAPTLELHHRYGGRRPFTFIVKPFSKSGIADIFQHIRQSNPMVRFDRVSEDMSRADFTTVTRKTVSTESLLRLAFVIGAIGVGSAIIKLVWYR